MWNDRRERKLPSAILRRRPANTNSPNPDGNTDANNNNKLRVKPLPSGPRPTFTGAQDWVQRHRGDIDTVVKLLDLYPNLIQTEGLDPLWDFLQPVILDKKAATSTKKTENRKDEGRTRRKNRGKNHVTHHRTRSNRSDSGSVRYVYVCDAPSSTDPLPSDKSTKDRIVAALSSYCYVRTSPELPVSQTDLAEVLNAVSTADAFLFLLNDGSLTSWFCLHQLGLAITYDTPIVAVREAGYALPQALPSEFDQLEIVRATSDVLSSPRLSQQQHTRSKSSETWQETRAKSESQSSGFHSDSENVFRQPLEESVCTLSDAIRNCFQTSVLYVPNFHDSCITKLFGRLSDYLGDIFLDAEVSKTEKRSRLRDSQSTDSENSDRLPDIKGSSVFRTLPSNQGTRDKNTERTPSSDGSHEPPETPTSTDKSSITPTSPPIKLPPINAVPKSVETPTPKEDPPEVTKNTMKSAPNFSDLFVSPPSSPFLATRYLVFPGEPKGSSKKPYLVTFPADVVSNGVQLEEKGEPSLEKVEDEYEEVEIKLLAMDDDPAFDKIKLDLPQDAISDKSPFSTPVPTARNPSVPREDPKTPKKDGKRTTKPLSPVERVPRVAERGDRFRTQNGKIRGIQLAERNKQTQITSPAKKYLRNSSSGWLTATGPFDKKNFKMTKVSLQYGPDGKLPNPLI